MKNTLLKTLAALAVALAVSNLTQADPITGSISFTGTPQYIGGHTGVKFSGAYVNAVPTGSFAPIGEFAGFGGPPINSPDTVTFSNIIFSPLTLPSGDIWTVSIPGGWTYSLQAQTIVYASPIGGQANFSGTGWFSITGSGSPFVTTLGTWGITLSQNGVLSFEATSGVGTPDGGTTALLVGAGLLALGLYARRSKQAKA